MPPRVLDLRTPDGKLDALAPYRVLTVMCHPDDEGARQHMISLVKVNSGTEKRRGAYVMDRQLWEQVKSCRGLMAGALLLNLLQLRGNKRRHSLNIGVRMVQGLLPEWDPPKGQERRDFDWSEHLPRRREPLLKAFNEYLSVAHLWAALLHAEEHKRHDIWLLNLAALPRFLANAEAFAEMGAKVRWLGRERRYVLPRNVPWRFVLPEHLREQADLRAMPLEPEQIAALNASLA